MQNAWLRVSPESGTYHEIILVHADWPDKHKLFVEIDGKEFLYTTPFLLEKTTKIRFKLNNEIVYKNYKIEIQSKTLTINNSDFLIPSDTKTNGDKLKASDILIHKNDSLEWENNNRKYKLSKQDIEQWPDLDCQLKTGIKYKLNNKAPIEINLKK